MNMVTDKPEAEDAVTEEEAIRLDYEKGLTYRDLAKKYRKSLRDITRIIKGEIPSKRETYLSIEIFDIIINKKPENKTQKELLARIFTDMTHFCLDVPLNFKDAEERKSIMQLIVDLKKLGYRINRADLIRFLQGKLDFLCVRWNKR